MRFFFPLVLCLLFLFCSPAFTASLKAVYDQSGPGSGFDRYIELDTGETYTGGLFIGGTFNRITAEFEQGGEDVRIKGNGAILDLMGRSITIAYCNNRLVIDDCVILNGDIVFRGYTDSLMDLIPTGSVKYVTFYKPHDYGVRLFSCGAGIELNRNIVVDAVDTGYDFMYLTGYNNSWLPTGGSFSFSLDNPIGSGGNYPHDNWSYHSDPVANADPVRHYNILCDYG